MLPQPLPFEDRIIIFRVGRARDISLNQLFLVAISLILACTLVLGISLVGQYHRALRESDQDLVRLHSFREVLAAANRVSAERGPTNVALGRDSVANDPILERLASYRQASDEAIARVAPGPLLAAETKRLRERLAQSRGAVDVLLAQPLAERGQDKVEQAIFAMFKAYDATQPVIGTAMTELLASDAELIGLALIAQMVAELRDYAGRLGSYVVIAITHGGPLSGANRAAFEQAQGRIMQIRDMISQQMTANAAASVREAHSATERAFFTDGLRLIDETHQRQGTPGAADTPESFTDAIVPSFAPIEKLRDTFFDAALAQLEDVRTEARTALFFAYAITAVVLGLVLLLLLASRSFLFAPLMRARERVIDLAEGRLARPIDKRGLTREMLHLFQALAVLRSRLIEREQLDAERNRLTAALTVQADTDGLTGVLNRGALERAVKRLAEAPQPPAWIGLIMLDLDYFKAVNDQHGHAAGDAALRVTAARLRHTLRQGDILARFGGEEFVIVVPDAGEARLLEMAERLRRAIGDTPFPIDDGSTIKLSASLGVARVPANPDVWPQLLKAADGALYEAKRQGRNRVVVRSATG
ncbi:GGDEF domain-containing protein [Bosea sp. BH3]|uniref:GGDEF domain-containing protein n=1 Tax=Bosea sp. BH3 TaxID=2871701 RepID=UPI0021CAFF23|nr:GGDEF domain-containing protein [Bosea sp. BH3]MCU4179011.1 GGDEF domain-containing protein [Bosea sp. BH3]